MLEMGFKNLLFCNMYFLNLGGGGFAVQSSASKYQIAMLHCTLGGAKIG